MAAVKELIAEGHHKVRETPEKLKYDTTRIRWRGNWRRHRAMGRRQASFRSQAFVVDARCAIA